MSDLSPFTLLLGIAQDAGFPQAGCLSSCCSPALHNPDLAKSPTSLALVNPRSTKRWLFDCTPHFPQQLRLLNQKFPPKSTPDLAGIFLTHAHVGHYTGLIHLGREVMDSKGVPLFVMPRMAEFLRDNAPWNALIADGGVELRTMVAGERIEVDNDLSVEPLLVPHRGEYSETVAFRISGPDKSVLYLPDIDRWEDWDLRIEDVLESVNVAYLDGTFFSAAELPARDVTQIPHPFVVDSLKRFSGLKPELRERVRFVHFNHSNPLLIPKSEERTMVEDAGHHVAEQGEIVPLLSTS